MRRFWRGRALAAVGLLCAAGGAAGQEGEGIATWVNVTGATVTRYPNALRVTIESDGALQVDSGFAFGSGVIIFGGQGDQRRTRIALPNARSQMGNFVFVGVYPISHLELEPTETGRATGTGLQVTIVTYVPTLFIGEFESPPGFFGEFGQPLLFISRLSDESHLHITALSDQMVPPEPPRLTDAQRAALPHSLAVDGDAASVRVAAVNIAPRELFERFTEVTGLSISVAVGVPDRISVFLPAMAPDAALEALADRMGLGLAQRERQWVLGPAEVLEASGYTVSTTERIPLTYLSAERALRLLPNVMLPYLRTDEERNALVVHAPRALIEKVREDLEALDRPMPLLDLRAMLVETSDTSDLQALLDLTTLHDKVRPATGDISYRNLGSITDFPTLEAQLHALEARDLAHIRQTALLRVRAGEGASLFSGDKKFITVVFGGDSITFPVDAGVSFGVHSFTGGDVIQMAFELRSGDIVAVDPVDRTPTIAQRRVSASVYVRPGETVMIGGIEQAERVTVRRGIPVLRDLPLLGGLFGSVQHRLATSTLTIFVTANLVHPGAGEEAH